MSLDFNMANAENDETEVGTSMTGTVNIKSQFNDGQDHFTPIVEQIRAREKENMESVKRLHDMIAKDRKKCIEMKFALQVRKIELKLVFQINMSSYF